MSAVVQSDVERLAVAFAYALRDAGVSVPLDSVITFVSAIEATGIDQHESVYWSGRTTLIRRPEDIDSYNSVFQAFWYQDQGWMPLTFAPVEQEHTLAVDDESGGLDSDSGDGSDQADTTLRFSTTELLREKDFAECTDEELFEAQKLMSRLRIAGPPRASLRFATDRHGKRPDLRRTVRGSLRHGGEPIKREWKDAGERQRRLVLLLDISGSMEPYARALLRFVHAAVAGRQKVEAFTIGTRLTRITKDLNERDPDKALAAAAVRVADWSGGTRLGSCLRDFNDQWGVRGVARGAIVVVLSDGWDRGEPELLGQQMERLHRVTSRIVWVNPLKFTPGYAPLAKGMAAALPHIDNFVEGHSLASMEELARVISLPLNTTAVRD